MNMSKLILIASLMLCTSAFAGETIDEVLDVGSNAQVSIESMRGEVHIVGWDKAQMSVSGELDDEAKGYTFESEDGFTVFKVKMPKRTKKRGWNNSKGSDLTIKLPKGANVRFESVNGNVSVKDVMGGSKIHTVNGNIEAESLAKRIKLDTVNGNIAADKLDGKIQLTTVNGRLKDINSKGTVSYNAVNGDITSRTAAAKVSAESVNGAIDLTLQTTEELEVSTVNGDVDAVVKLSDDGQVSITTVSGSARLKLSGNIGGRYRLNSHAGGSIRNKLTEDRVKKQKYGPGRSLKFRLNGGDGNIEMTSVSGNLSIEQK